VTLEFLLKRFVATAGLPWIERHVSWFGTSLPDEAFASEGTSAGRGPMTIRQMLDDLVIDHLESHVEQVRRAVG
jgi:hypothetical protein